MLKTVRFLNKNCIPDVQNPKKFRLRRYLFRIPYHYISPIGPNNYVLVAVLYEVKNLYKFYRRFVIDSNIVSKNLYKFHYRFVVGSVL